MSEKDLFDDTGFVDYPVPPAPGSETKVTRPEQKIKGFNAQANGADLRTRANQLASLLSSGQGSAEDMQEFSNIAGKAGLSDRLREIRERFNR